MHCIVSSTQSTDIVELLTVVNSVRVGSSVSLFNTSKAFIKSGLPVTQPLVEPEKTTLIYSNMTITLE